MSRVYKFGREAGMGVMGAGYGSPRNPWGPLGPVQTSRASRVSGCVRNDPDTDTMQRYTNAGLKGFLK